MFLEGSSEAFKAVLLAELRGAWAAQCPESPRAHVFHAAEADVDAVLSAWQGGSLFAPRDFVIVLDIEDWARSERKLRGLAAGLGSGGGESCLVLVESAADTPRKSLDALRAACDVRVEATPPGPRELAAWAARRFAREGLSAGEGVVDALLEACEGECLTFFNELDKLVLLVPRGGTIDADSAMSELRPALGAGLRDYLGAVARGDPARAARSLTRLLAGGAGEGSLLFALANLVGGALGGWARQRDLSEALRRRRSSLGLAEALDAVYRAEAAWKGGRLDVVAALEQATRAVAGPDAPARNTRAALAPR